MSYRSYGATECLLFLSFFFFLPLKFTTLDFGLDMKRLDSFKLLSAPSSSVLPDGFNKHPRSVASAADGLGCARLLSILSHLKEGRAKDRIVHLMELFSLHPYPLIVLCILFLSLNVALCSNVHVAFRDLL